jgi:hypothetical protein
MQTQKSERVGKAEARRGFLSILAEVLTAMMYAQHSATDDYSKITTIQPSKRSGKRYSRDANFSAGCFEYLAEV